MIDVDECVEDDDYVTAVWVMLENCFVRVDGVRKGGGGTSLLLWSKSCRRFFVVVRSTRLYYDSCTRR